MKLHRIRSPVISTGDKYFIMRGICNLNAWVEHENGLDTFFCRWTGLAPFAGAWLGGGRGGVPGSRTGPGAGGGQVESQGGIYILLGSRILPGS